VQFAKPHQPGTIIRDIEKLKKIGVIKRIGPDKGGYWEIHTPKT
jgi:predicted HTH transcriptional regulator